MRLRIRAFRLGYSCGSSSLQIFDGKSSSSNLLKKFCGKDYNLNVFSSGRHLLVQYDSRQELAAFFSMLCLRLWIAVRFKECRMLAVTQF